MSTEQPESFGPGLHAVAGVFVDAAWFDAYTNNPPADAQLRMNGSTPLRRVERLRERWESRQRATQVERYNDLLSSRADSIKDADETLALIPEKVTGWLAAMHAGTLEPEEVQRLIAEIPAVITAVTQTYTDAEADAEAAYAMVDMTPGEYTEQLAERFPSLRTSGPYVTEGWLRGELGAPDPLGDQ